MRKRKWTVRVEVDLTSPVDRDTIETYVRHAVEIYQGSLRPPDMYGDADDFEDIGDPMFGNVKLVTILRRRSFAEVEEKIDE